MDDQEDFYWQYDPIPTYDDNWNAWNDFASCTPQKVDLENNLDIRRNIEI